MYFSLIVTDQSFRSYIFEAFSHSKLNVKVKDLDTTAVKGRPNTDNTQTVSTTNTRDEQTVITAGLLRIVSRLLFCPILVLYVVSVQDGSYNILSVNIRNTIKTTPEIVRTK